MTIDVQGEKLVSLKMRRSAAAAADPLPAYREVLAYFFSIEGVLFESGGRRGGGAWARNTPETRLRKLKQGQDLRVLHATHALRRSLTRFKDPHQRIVARPDFLLIESTLPYAIVHHLGLGHMPRRPIVKITPTDRRKFAEIFREHIGSPFHGWQKVMGRR